MSDQTIESVATESAYCTSCGSAIKGTAKFCNGCGARQPVDDQPAASERPREASVRGEIQLEPEKQIRRYLDREGGSVEVPARDLLTTWSLERFTPDSRGMIAAALDRVGIRTQPTIAEVGEDMRVRLPSSQAPPSRNP